MFGFGVINQNSPHHRRGDGVKVRTAFPGGRFLLDQSEIRFVNQSGGLESVSDPLLLQIATSLPMQFRVDKFEEGVSRIVAPIIAPIA
jgi:hypothetical protein